MGSWADIPIDLAQEIVGHLEFYEDHEKFRQVCSRWRSAVKEISNAYKTHQPPWLMLADKPESTFRRYYSLVNSMVCKIDLPPALLGSGSQNNDHNEDQTRRYFSSRGWIISVTQSREITLFSPLSRKVIKLPSMPVDLIDSAYGEWEDWMLSKFFFKFIVSKTPFCSDDNDLTIALIFEGYHCLAFWRSGEEGWIKRSLEYGWIHDICFFREEFYAINDTQQVWALGNNKQPPRKVANLNMRPLVPDDKNENSFYLLDWVREGGGSTLLVICRGVHVGGDYEHESWWFRVFDLNVETGALQPLKSLANRAIFVGHNSTFSVVASGDERGCKANSIYFADDYQLYDEDSNSGGSDMGVYNLLNDKVDPSPYQGPSSICHITPPIWVEIIE